MMAGWILAIFALAWAASDDAKSQPPDSSAEEIFLLGKDLVQLYENEPDAVILFGDQARAYLKAMREGERPGPAPVLAQTCRIRGELDEGQARLILEITARSLKSGRNPLLLSLAEANLLDVKFDGGPPFLTRDNSGWTAWLDGPGSHTIYIEAQVPLTGSTDLPGLSCGIPEAPITTLELRSGRAMSEVRLGPAAPLTVRPPGDPKPQVEATLGPRTRLDLRWHRPGKDAARPTPLVRATSEVVATVELGVIQLRTELTLQLLRGSQQHYELLAASDEQILDVHTTDGSSLNWSQRVEDGQRRITLDFLEPVASGAQLVVTSRVPWSADTATLRGLTVEGVYSHSSTIALRSAAELDVAVMELRSARRVESLPATLRSPRNEAAVAAYAQPFQMKLSILPRRVNMTVRSTTLLAVEANQTILFGRWLLATHGGRLPYVDFQLPEPLQPAGFLLNDSVQSVRIEPPGSRTARVFLKGMPETFEIRFLASVPHENTEETTRLALPAPTGARIESSRIYLAGNSAVSIDGPSELTPIEEPLDPSLVPDGTNLQGARGYQTRAAINHVNLRFLRANPSIRHTITAQLQFDPSGSTVRQSIQYRVRGGVIRRLRLNVPPRVRDSVELVAAAGQTLAEGENGEMIVQLMADVSDSVRVQLKFNLPPDEPDETAMVEVPLIRAEDGECETTDVFVLSSADWRWSADETEWPRMPNTDESVDREMLRLAVRRRGAANEVILHREPVPADAPPIVIIDRAFVETTASSNGAWRTRAQYAIASAPAGRIGLRVPPGGRITQVLWAGQPVRLHPASTMDTSSFVEFVTPLAESFPGVLVVVAESAGAVANAASLASQHAWYAPEPVGEVSWGRIYWMLNLPDRLALLRRPADYDAENRLEFDSATVRFRPSIDRSELDEWLAGASQAPARRPFPSDGTSQRYLYSRLVSMAPLTAVSVNRPVLVLVASAVVLLLGILWIGSSGRTRTAIVMAVAIGVSICSVLEPMATWECVRAAGLGLLVVGIAGACHAWLWRRHLPKRSVFPEPGMLARVQGSSLRSGPGSSVERSVDPNQVSTGSAPRLRSSSIR